MISADRPALADSGVDPTHGVGELPQPVPWVANLVPAIHGAYHRRSHDRSVPPIDPQQVLDFSANGNVIGPPPPS